jgi:tryptophan-rich sensory protein
MEFLIIILPLIIGSLIGFFTKPDKWYRSLKRPLYSPPSYIFSIVWPVLYILIGVSYYLALKDKPLIYWFIPLLHLLINFSFSPVMFSYKRLLEGAAITLLTLMTLIVVMILFYNYQKYISVYLLIPYLLWLIFANYLAWSIYYIN